MASIKFYDTNDDGTFNIMDVQKIIQQHPNISPGTLQEFQSIAMGLITQGGMITPGSEVPGSQPLQYNVDTGDMSDTELEAGALGDETTDVVTEQGVGGGTGFGFDESENFTPEDRQEVGDYLTNTLGLDSDLVAKIQGNINLYDPTKEQQLQTQYGFDVGALGQQQRGSILEGIAGTGQQAFAGRGLVSGRRRANYRQGITEAQRQFETGLAQKQFGFAQDIDEVRKDYDFVGELNKLKEMGQLTDAEFQSAVGVVQDQQEAGVQGEVTYGYPTQQEYLDSNNMRSEVPANANLSPLNFATLGSTEIKDLFELDTLQGSSSRYTKDSSFKPKWKGYNTEDGNQEVVSFTANPFKRVGSGIESTTMPDDKINVIAKWVGTSGQGDWEVTKS